MHQSALRAHIEEWLKLKLQPNSILNQILMRNCRRLLWRVGNDDDDDVRYLTKEEEDEEAVAAAKNRLGNSRCGSKIDCTEFSEENGIDDSVSK